MALPGLQLASVATAVVISDQVVKALVLRHKPCLVLQTVAPARRHRWFAIGLGAGSFALKPGLTVRAVIVSFAIASVAAVIVAGVSGAGTMEIIGWGAAVGGAAGNVIDRCIRGRVLDFLAIGRWPAFNLADAAIVAGVVLAMIGGITR